MNAQAGALAFLIARTTRNRIAKQVSRVKNPRYAFALLFGIGYLYLTFFRPGMSAQPGSSSFLTGSRGAFISGMVFFSVSLAWLFGRTASALAFLPAEVQFLLPGPLSRRQLLIYRMVRAQLVVLLNAFIWAILLRKFGVAIPAAIRFGSAWAIFSLLSLHQLGTALVLAEPAQGARRLAGWLVRGVMALAVVALIVGIAPVVMHFGEGNFTEGMASLGRATTTPPISTVLAPFRLVTAPMLAETTAAWFQAFAVVLILFAAHVAWILGMDVEFADIAVAASAKRAARVAAMRAARSGTSVAPKSGKATRQWLPLAPVGNPAVAITWKNTMSLLRGAGTRTLIMLVAVGIPFVIMSKAGSSRGGAATSGLAALPYLMIVGMTLLMGPRMMRNDLRQDLLRLSTLKTFPLKGSVLVAGEILSPTLVLTIFQLVMLAIGAVMVPDAMQHLAKAGISSVLLLLVPPALLALNGVNVVIQNGVTLMFPSWVRLGSDSGGIEAMGQNLLVTFGGMFALMLSLLLPGGAAAAMVVFVRLTAGTTAIVPAVAAAVTVAVILLLGEIVAMVNIFGRTFERMDPTQIG